MVDRLTELFLEGKIDDFLEGVKELDKEHILTLLAKAIKDGIAKKDEILKEASRFESSNSSEELSFLGLIYTLIGELSKAEEVLKKAIGLKDVDVFAYYRLGNLYLIRGEYEKAEEFLKKGLDKKEKAEGWHNLGFLYTKIAEDKKALEAYKRGWDLKPYSFAIAKKAIEILKKNNLLDEFEEELEKKDKNSQILSQLALIKLEKKDIKDALIKLTQAVSLDEDNEELRNLYIDLMLSEERYWVLGERLVEWVKKYDRLKEHLALAQCRIKAGFLEKAKEGLDAIKDRVKADKLEYDLLVAEYYKENNEFEKAKEILEKLYKDYPQNVRVATMLSDLYSSLGEIEKSKEVLDSLGKDAIGVLIRKVESKDVIKDDLEKLERYLDEIEDDDTKSNIHFGLAKGYDRIKDYKKASFHIKKANDLVYQKLDYSIEDFREEVNKIIESFSSEWVKAKQNTISFDKRPIFIVGMPRSGTTMLEQIFAAHNKVFGAGELPYIGKIINLSEKITKKSYPHSFLYEPKKFIAQAGEYYIELTKRMYKFDEPIFVDKLPHNFLHSALLVAMFKDSKVIALRRDYRDIALSNYFQNFAAKRGTLGYAFNLEAMGEHIKDYLRIMEFYKEILPEDRYKEFWYEDLVLNPKEKIPEVLEFCELDFTDEVLEFYKNKTAVRTASVLQVRNPIYTKSIHKWKNYKELLKPVIDIVGDKGIYELKDRDV